MIRNIGTDECDNPLVLAALNGDERIGLICILNTAEAHLDEILRVSGRRMCAEAMIGTLREMHGLPTPKRAEPVTAREV